MAKVHFKAVLIWTLSGDGENALEGPQSVLLEVDLEKIPRTNLAFALHDSSRIFLEKKNISYNEKLHMYICTEY